MKRKRWMTTVGQFSFGRSPKSVPAPPPQQKTSFQNKDKTKRIQKKKQVSKRGESLVQLEQPE
jgi:hypothetical protein